MNESKLMKRISTINLEINGLFEELFELEMERVELKSALEILKTRESKLSNLENVGFNKNFVILH